MRLLEILLNGDFHLTNFPDDAIPPYAILSHTWGDESQEVTFEDIIRRSASEKEGYKKIRFCGEQAILDGLQYFWIDTCCIDKSNPVELSQAISAMFRWYRNAKQCYVYLSDVSDSPNEHDSQPWDSDFWKSRWFTRGWTLQELVAPHSVVFFSREGKRLGNKDSLKQQIHAITRVPMLALEGASLSQFSVEERFLWIKHRRTKLEEDMVYSLLGIFDIEMPLFYGEGAVAAFNRLREIIDKRAKCTQDLYTTDPRKDKLRIEESKGGLLMDSYYWILEHDDFKQWRNTNQSRLLWIKGDPGKGKTMMLCGIINELNKPYGRAQHLSYFFCQATDSRINDATAVLRGLLYLLVDQQPSIISHILRQHDHAGRNLFEDANAWVALSEIFISVLHDPGLQSGYMIIDGLDECVGDLPKLLDFIVQVTSEPSPIKWLVSSRNDANIERKLQSNNSGTRLSLELRENAEQVSNAVNAYIDRCLRDLPDIQSDNSLQDSIREKIRRKANGTFLWVSLVVKELKEAMSWEVLQLLDELPLELMGLYRRMMDHIKRLPRKYPELCLHVIKVVVAAYRPLHLRELHSLSSLPSHAQDIDQFTTSIVRMCGSFLTIKDDNVYIIHQSAKDFLCDAASYEVFPRGSSDAHYTLFSNSLRVLSRTLYRDMYGLCNPGYSITQVKQPEPDPLIASRYACIYWVDHLYDWSFGAEQIDELRDGGSVDVFIQKKFLYWLEALSICRSMPQGVIGMMKLKTLIQVSFGLVNDGGYADVTIEADYKFRITRPYS
jgi:hypothetical protein